MISFALDNHGVNGNYLSHYYVQKETICQDLDFGLKLNEQLHRQNLTDVSWNAGYETVRLRRLIASKILLIVSTLPIFV